MTATSAPPRTALVRQKSRGVYIDPVTNEELRSVTTILGQGVPKEALIHWAGNLVAETAMDNLAFLFKEATEPARRKAAYDWLRAAHTRKKEERADVGSAVHRLIEAHILGEPVPQELLDDEEMRPYLEHFRRFVDEFEVTFAASEMVVANYTHGYAGTLDYMMRSPRIGGGKLQMGDTKTGGELGIKGVYPDAGLQMAAYRHAEFGWLRNGQRVPLPQTHGGIVLHLRPEGYHVVPVECGEQQFTEFLHAKHIAQFTSVTSKSVVGNPLHPAAEDGHQLLALGERCRYCGFAPKRVPAQQNAETAESFAETFGLCAECSGGEFDNPKCGACGKGIDLAETITDPWSFPKELV